jgi:FkbM family methyltransferase
MHGYPVAIMWMRDLPAWLGAHPPEPGFQARLAAVVRELRPARFLDVGANLGSYSWFVRRISPETEVLLFEPDATNAALLRRTIAKNRFDRMQVIEAAVADQPGTVSFTLDDASGTTGGIVDQSRLASSIQATYRLGARVDVPAVTLDEFVLPSQSGDTVVKIDVEAAEMLVLAGASRFVQVHRPLMFVEAFEAGPLDAWAAANGYTRQPLDAFGNHLLTPAG